MASRSIKAALADVLENLSEENFKKFCHHLMDLRAGLRVRRTAVEGKSCLEVADVMVSTFTEAKVVAVAEEILRAIGCNLEADDLASVEGPERWWCPGT
uniref:Pyrin domain-containing protein n=1 Tax=Mastacembelus armatus TaxID=205130 RepID=A0A3Q3LYP5_9TELE